MKKPRLYYSAINLFQMCGEAFRREYIEGERTHSNFYLARGGATHRGRQINLTQKIESKTDLPVTDVLDATRDEVIKTFAGNDVDRSGEFEGMSSKALMSMCIDSSVKLARKDYDAFQKRSEPTNVELKIKLEFSNAPFDMIGTIDQIDLGSIIRDCKTAKQTPNQTTADQSEQLSMYQILFQAYFGKAPKELSLDYLIPLKTGVKSLRLITTRDEKDLQAVLNRVTKTYEAIKRGVFVPAPQTHWKCSREFCQFFNSCPYSIGKNK